MQRSAGARGFDYSPASIAVELCAQIPAPDAVFVAVGGGGLIAVRART